MQAKIFLGHPSLAVIDFLQVNHTDYTTFKAELFHCEMDLGPFSWTYALLESCISSKYSKSILETFKIKNQHIKYLKRKLMIHRSRKYKNLKFNKNEIRPF